MDKVDDFYLVLPSNSSMLYFPDNTTTNFTTLLSHEVKLSGDWSVGLAEIHIPCTFTHIRENEAYYTFRVDEKSAPEKFYFPQGVYDSLELLVREINESPGIRDHMVFEFPKYQKGYYMLRRKCECKSLHVVSFPEKIRRILGFEDEETRQTGTFVDSGYSIVAMSTRPATIARAIPDQLYVYTDVCEPYNVGDTQAALLRIVSLDSSKYRFGSNAVRQFMPIHYIPLLHHSFRRIVIDIRDQHGERLPFEYGTLTVSLHFTRNR